MAKIRNLTSGWYCVKMKNILGALREPCSPFQVSDIQSTYTCNVYAKSRLDVISTLPNPQANYTPWDFSSCHIPPSLPALTDHSPLMNQPSKLYNSRGRFFFNFLQYFFFHHSQKVDGVSSQLSSISKLRELLSSLYSRYCSSPIQ